MIRKSNTTSRLLNGSGDRIITSRQKEFLFTKINKTEDIKIVKINFFKRLCILIKNKVSLYKTKLYEIRYIRSLFN